MQLSKLLTEIWKALASPAGSYEEIVSRVNVQLQAQGLPQTTFASVNQAIYWLRHAEPKYYGWTIPHCKRGPTQANRLVRVAVNAAGAPLVAMKRGAAQEGASGTLSHVGTIMGHGAKMMVILAPQFPAPKMQRKARAMVRKMNFLADEAAEMLEAINDEKWA